MFSVLGATKQLVLSLLQSCPELPFLDTPHAVGLISAKTCARLISQQRIQRIAFLSMRSSCIVSRRFHPGICAAGIEGPYFSLGTAERMK